MKQSLPGRRIWPGAGLVAALVLAVMTGCMGISPRGAAAQEDALPAFFDVRDNGKAPVVKSQGNLGTCWALTATSALEAAFMPQADPVFSADHMSLHNGFVISQDEGGDYKMIMAYLSGWYGPVLESEDPYGDQKTNPAAQTAAHVQQMRILDGENAEGFKRAVYTYGPVQSSLYMDKRSADPSKPYYNEENCAYYYPEEKKKNHDVLILGWDDLFPAESFSTDPGMDGAWICQNTWGEDFGEEGIFYVSYADANFVRTGLSYEQVDTTARYDRIYQADQCGWQGRLGYDYESCYFANVYTSKGAEELAAVGFYSTGERTDYEVYLIHDFEDTESFVHKRLIGTGSLEGIGFYTVLPDKPQPLAAGERFAVAVYIHTEGARKPVAVELKKDAYTQLVTTQGKESYTSLAGGTWENTQSTSGSNVCLKAYTTLSGTAVDSE